MTNLHPSKGTTTPGTALMPKHAGWAAAQSGKPGWIIDSDNSSDADNWFTYTPEEIIRVRYVRKHHCQQLRAGEIP